MTKLNQETIEIKFGCFLLTKIAVNLYIISGGEEIMHLPNMQERTCGVVQTRLLTFPFEIGERFFFAWIMARKKKIEREVEKALTCCISRISWYPSPPTSQSLVSRPIKSTKNKAIFALSTKQVCLLSPYFQASMAEYHIRRMARWALCLPVKYLPKYIARANATVLSRKWVNQQKA